MRTGVDATLMKENVLADAPLRGDMAIEHVTSANGGLFENQLMVTFRVSSRVQLGVAKP